MGMELVSDTSLSVREPHRYFNNRECTSGNLGGDTVGQWHERALPPLCPSAQLNAESKTDWLAFSARDNEPEVALINCSRPPGGEVFDFRWAFVVRWLCVY